MRVIKNINNNVSVCLDSTNTEVVVFGKGVGFTKPPYEIELSKIERTYYDVDETYLRMIKDLSPQIIEIATQIVDVARMKPENSVNSNTVFTLADHLQFAVKRTQEHMNVKLPLLHDIEYLFQIEMEIGKRAVQLIKERLNVLLPPEEAGYVALHLINAQKMSQGRACQNMDEKMIEVITAMIEADFELTIDRRNFNYSRFVSHMHYLLKRGKINEQINSENKQLYQTIQATYPKVRDCSIKICKYLERELNCQLSEEECLYLMLHINRLCAREDCYR